MNPQVPSWETGLLSRLPWGSRTTEIQAEAKKWILMITWQNQPKKRGTDIWMLKRWGSMSEWVLVSRVDQCFCIVKTVLKEHQIGVTLLEMQLYFRLLWENKDVVAPILASTHFMLLLSWAQRKHRCCHKIAASLAYLPIPEKQQNTLPWGGGGGGLLCEFF